MNKRFNDRLKYYYAGFGLIAVCIYLVIGAITPIAAILVYKSFLPLLAYIPYPIGLCAAECLSDYIKHCDKKERENKNGDS